MASVVVGAVQVCFTAVAALIIDKTGRKVLLYMSGKTYYWLQLEKELYRVPESLVTVGGIKCYNLCILSGLLYNLTMDLNS